MSADLLRRAAALMRREATEPHMIAVIKRRTTCDARVHHGADGPWRRDPDHPKWCNAQPGGATRHAPSDQARTRDVALAVADWLDDEADQIPPGANETRWGPIENAPAVRVARAYLGES